jgi:queuine tRNA-ribosyltransferase
VNHLDKVPVKYGYDKLFPLLYKEVAQDLRQQSAEYIANSDQVGNAIGGLSVEPAEEMYAMTEVVRNFARRQTPLLDGVGTPIIFWKTFLGVDV